MGGSGSGNRWRFGTRATCEGMKRVELAYMRRRGMLVPGSAGSLSWNVGGRPSGDIRYRTESECLVLIYRFKENGDENWTGVNERVPYTFTEQKLGGSRRWFCCPSCQRRCSIIYGGKWFRCRKCHNLAYSTQNESPMFRGLTRAQKLRERLGGSLCIDDPFPAKPKGMHWKTYARIRINGEAYENRVHGISTDYLRSLAGSLKKAKSRR
jgi:hypothetical protein